MDYFIVSVLCQTLLEEFVGQDASLGEAIHCPSDLHVYKPVLGFFAESILVDDVGGEGCACTRIGRAVR